MLVVAERDRIQTAFRCFAAHELAEAVLREHLGDRANPIGSFGMSRRGQVVEACPMREKKRSHTIPWRIERACEDQLI
jgi:hypothetical protein